MDGTAADVSGGLPGCRPSVAGHLETSLCRTYSPVQVCVVGKIPLNRDDKPHDFNLNSVT